MKKSDQRKKRGVPSRKELYAKVAPFSELAINTLVEIMEKGYPDAVRLGAAKVILNKVLPDLKIQEVSIEPEKPLGVVVLPALNDEVVIEDKPEKAI